MSYQTLSVGKIKVFLEISDNLGSQQKLYIIIITIMSYRCSRQHLERTMPSVSMSAPVTLQTLPSPGAQDTALSWSSSSGQLFFFCLFSLFFYTPISEKGVPQRTVFDLLLSSGLMFGDRIQPPGLNATGANFSLISISSLEPASKLD